MSLKQFQRRVLMLECSAQPGVPRQLEDWEWRFVETDEVPLRNRQSPFGLTPWLAGSRGRDGSQGSRRDPMVVFPPARKSA